MQAQSFQKNNRVGRGWHPELKSGDRANLTIYSTLPILARSVLAGDSVAWAVLVLLNRDVRSLVLLNRDVRRRSESGYHTDQGLGAGVLLVLSFWKAGLLTFLKSVG